MTNWREKVDPIIKHHLEEEVRESVKCKDAYSEANIPSNAQLWCAIANLSKKIFDLNLKLVYLERALKDTLMRKDK